MTDSYNLGPENIDVFCDSEIVWMGEGIYTPEGVLYIPYATKDGQIGYVVHGIKSGQQEFIYLNASTGTDDGKPNVFLYQGESGNANEDGPEHFYLVAEKFDL
jgi:hypothetical protein